MEMDHQTTTTVNLNHHCLNCSQSLSPDQVNYEIKIDWDKNKEKPTKILVKQVITNLYNLHYLDTLKITQENDDDDLIGVCENCYNDLIILYKIWSKFNQVRNLDSYLTDKINNLNNCFELMTYYYKAQQQQDEEPEVEIKNEFNLETDHQHDDNNYNEESTETGNYNYNFQFNQDEGEEEEAIEFEDETEEPQLHLKNNHPCPCNHSQVQLRGVLSFRKSEAKLSHPAECLVCGAKFHTITKLQDHLQDHTKDEIVFKKSKSYIKSRLPCAFCRKILKSKEDWWSHTGTHLAWICSICLKTYRFKESLMAHHRKRGENVALAQQEDPSISNLTCRAGDPSCSITFCVFEHLKDHEEAHPEKNFQCATCPLLFSVEANKSQHELKCPYKPPTCPVPTCPDGQNNKIFKSHDHLRDHLFAAHTIEIRGDGKKVKFLCELCSKMLTSEAFLRQHLRLHTGEGKRYMKNGCPVCHKRLNSLANRRSHMKLHPEFKEEAGIEYGNNLETEIKQEFIGGTDEDGNPVEVKLEVFSDEEFDDSIECE